MKRQRKPKPPRYVDAMLNGVIVRVTLRDGGGGELRVGKPRATIKIGADDGWNDAVGTLLHETMEMCALLLDLRFACADTPRTSENLMFFWTHEQFRVLCDRSGEFIAEVLPEVAAMWNARQEAKEGA